MNRWLMTTLFLGLLLAWSPTAHGNGAVPPRPIGPGVVPGPGFGPPGPVKAKFVVEVDEKAKEARLVVPMNLMMQGFVPGGGGLGALGAPPGAFMGVPPGGAFGAMGVPPGGKFPTPPPGAPPGFQPPEKPKSAPGKLPGGVGQVSVPTVVAGLALTMAMASGGFWLVRRGNGRTLAGILVVATLAVGATALFADIGPGPRPRPPQPPRVEGPKGTPVPMPATVKLSDKIQFQVTVGAGGDTIRLIVPKDAVTDKGEEEEKKPEGKKPRKEDE